MNLIVRLTVAVVLMLLSAASWAQLNYYTLLDSDNNPATGCAITLPTAGTVAGIERRLTASVSETAAPQVTRLTLENCAGAGFDAPATLPGTPYPVGSNNGIGGADVIEQAVSAGAVAAPGATLRLYFAAQGPAGDDLLGATSSPPILLDIQPGGGPADIPFLSGPGFLVLALLLLGVVLWQRSRLPGSVVGILLVGTLAGIAWAAGFRLDGQIGDWQGVSAVGADAQGDSTPNTDIVAAFTAQEGGNLFFRIDVANAETTPPSNRAPVFTSTAVTIANVASPYRYAIAASDPDGNALTLTAPTLPSWLTFAPGANGTGTLSGTPGPADLGPHAVVLRATDNGTPNLSTDQAFTITVGAAANPAPVLDLNGPAAGIDFAATFTEGGGAIAIVDPSNLTVIDPDSLNLASATVTLINPLDAGQETLAVSAATVAPSTPITATFNAATGALTLTGAATLAQYQAALRTVTYNNSAAAPTATPARVVTFAVSDGSNTSAVATATVTLTGVNDQPSLTASNPPAVNEDAGPQTVNGWATFDPGAPDESGQTATYPVSNVSNAALFSTPPAVDASGNLSYAPAPNAFGTSTFDVQVRDSGGTANGGVDTSAPQTFTITVNGINDQPSFTASNPPVANENAGSQTVPGWAIFNPGNPQENAQTALAYTVSSVSNTALFGAQPSVATNGTLTYTPAAGVSGTSTFSVAVQDDGGTANGGVDTGAAQAFTITVNAVNDPPVAVADATSAAEGGTVTTLTTPAGATSVLADDSDPDAGDILSVTSTPVSGPANGSLTLNANGTFSYTHNGGETTSDSFTYQVCDNGNPSLCATATVSIVITPANDGPTANADSLTVGEGGTQTVLDSTATSVRANDTDPDNLSTALTVNTTPVTPPANGNLTLNADGTFSYTHDGGETTTDSFIYQICDPQPLCATAAASIVITPVNDAPVIALPGAVAQYDTVTPALLDTTATASDIDSPNFDTGALTANVTTNCEANDRLGVRNEGTGPDQIGVSGANVTFNPAGSGAVTIGTTTAEFDCGTPAPTLAITLNANATPAATQALLRNLVYFSATTPTGTARAVDVVLTDGDGGTSNTATKTVTIDAAPTVFTIVPANSATGVAINADVVIAFSENVTVTGNWFQIACPTSGNRSALSGTAVTGGPTVFAINPTVDFANGETCAVTVTALQVTDQDTLDPPDNMATDFNSTFTTVDVAPTVLASSTPANGSVVPTNQTVVLNFSEAVNVVPANIGLVCGGATVAVTTSGTSNVTAITLTPAAALAEGASCTLTVPVTAATDTDTSDPPDELGAAFTRTFSVDSAPAFVSSSPANGNVNVAVGSNIGINFSEAVNVTTGSFTLDCGGGSLTYSLTGSGTNIIGLDPSANLPGGTVCTVTIDGGSVSDADTADPPNVVASSPNFSFTTQALAENDAYNTTPHLTLAVDTGVQSGRVTANDQLGVGSITGFGFGVCTGTTPGAQLDAGAANGRFTLDADGSFSYEPPAGVANTTRTFCYTVSGGDTANIVFTLQNTELVWFVDAAAAAGGVGSQARPFQTLAAAVGVDTNNDTIFVEHNASGYTCGISLLPNEKLIGEGSGSTLGTLSGVTPVAGSSFPTLTNSSAQWPTLTAAGADCVTPSTDNTIRGFNFGNVGAANTAIVGSGIGTLTVNDAAIATDGAAINLSTGTFNATLDSVSSSGGVFNVRLNQIVGTVDLGSGALTGALSGVAFVVSGFDAPTNTAAITYGGSITAGRVIDIQAHSSGNITLSGVLLSNGTATAINIANNISGTITLSNPSKVITTAANPAVTLSNNTGATINFTGGGLAISTTSGAGFSAGGGGTITVQGNGNTITSGSGTALNVANTTIGASGLTFQSISANGGANGILLNNTGASGGLTVTGTGTTDGTGGTIQNTTNRGASFISASNITLNNMNFTNAGTSDLDADNSGLSTGDNLATNAAIHLQSVTNATLDNLNITGGAEQGINGHNVNAFTLSNSALSNLGNGPDEDGIHFFNMSGASAITNTTIASSGDDNVNIQNNTNLASISTVGTINVTGGSFNAGVLGSGLLFGIRGTFNTAINISGVTLDNNFSGGIVADSFDTATLRLDVTGITDINNNDGIQVSGHNGSAQFDVHDNSDASPASGLGIYSNDFVGITLLKSAFSTLGRLEGRVTTTEITIANERPADAIFVFGAGGSDFRTAITDNGISYRGTQRPIIVQGGQDGAAIMDATITGNDIDMQLDGTNDAASGIQTSLIIATPVGGCGVGAGCGSTLCADIGGAGALGNVFTHSLGGGMAGGDIRVRQRNTGPQRLPGYGGAGGDTAAVIAYLTARNTVISAPTAATNDNLFSGGGACNAPVVP